MCLPQRAENRFFEVPTRTSEVRGAFPTDRNKLIGDEPRQFGNFENAVGYVVVGHGGSRVNHTGNGPIGSGWSTGRVIVPQAKNYEVFFRSRGDGILKFGSVL